MPSFSTVREDNEDARSVASSSGVSTAPSSWSSAASAGGTKRTADDVLGDFMSDDDDEAENVDAQGDKTMALGGGDAKDSMDTSSNISTMGTPRPNKSFPRRRGGFAHTQTMPASLATTRYLASAAPRAQDDIDDDGKWRQFRFEEYSKREDF